MGHRRGAGEIDRTLQTQSCGHAIADSGGVPIAKHGSPELRDRGDAHRLHDHAPTYRATRSYPRHHRATGHAYRRTPHHHADRLHAHAPAAHAHTRHDARCDRTSGGGSACCACHAQQWRLMDYSCRATAGHEALVALRICHAPRAQIQRATPSRRKTHYRKPSPQGRSCGRSTEATGPFARPPVDAGRSAPPCIAAQRHAHTAACCSGRPQRCATCRPVAWCSHPTVAAGAP